MISPFAYGDGSGLLFDVLLHTLFIVSLFSATYSICRLRWQLITALVLGLPTLAVVLLIYGFQEDRAGPILAVLYAVFFTYVAALMLSYVVRERAVTANTIFASLCVYFLIGVIFAMVYVVIEAAHPESFFIATTSNTLQPVEFGAFGNFSYFFYYSFVTLTTLGYGDITPVTLVAGTFASLEAVFGQLYLVILVARLVGLHINRRGQFQIR